MKTNDFFNLVLKMLRNYLTLDMHQQETVLKELWVFLKADSKFSKRPQDIIVILLQPYLIHYVVCII